MEQDPSVAPRASAPRQTPIRFATAIFSLLGIALLTCVAGAYRLAVARQTEPLELTFKYRSVEIDASAAQAIISRHSVVPVKDSKYSWTIVSDAELAKLLVLDGKPALVLSKKERKIDGWPMVAESDGYSLIINAQKPNMYAITGGLTANLGSRRIASERQARIDGTAYFNRGAAAGGHRSSIAVQGRFFYEGAVPRGHLVFFKPLDKQSWHAVIFEVV